MNECYVVFYHETRKNRNNIVDLCGYPYDVMRKTAENDFQKFDLKMYTKNHFYTSFY